MLFPKSVALHIIAVYARLLGSRWDLCTAFKVCVGLLEDDVLRLKEILAIGVPFCSGYMIIWRQLYT